MKRNKLGMEQRLDRVALLMKIGILESKVTMLSKHELMILKKDRIIHNLTKINLRLQTKLLKLTTT